MFRLVSRPKTLRLELPSLELWAGVWGVSPALCGDHYGDTGRPLALQVEVLALDGGQDLRGDPYAVLCEHPLERLLLLVAVMLSICERHEVPVVGDEVGNEVVQLSDVRLDLDLQNEDYGCCGWS